MLKFLNKPYPSDHSFSHGIKSAISISIFLIIFFLIFQPFGIGEAPSDIRYKSIFFYGIANFISIITVFFLLKFIFPKFYQEENWVIWKEILLYIILFFFITVGCMLANHVNFNHPFNIGSIMTLYFLVISIGVLPVGFSILTKYNQQLKKHLKEAQAMNETISKILDESEEILEEENLITLHSDNKNEVLTLDPKQFFFAESSANYVTIHYLENGNPKKEMLRTTMKNLSNDLEVQENIVRCHRSFFINLNQIKNINGDSRGYEINLVQDMGTVPVSRSYISAVKSYLK